MSLQVKDLAKSFGTRQLFASVTFAVNPGEKVALVGGNGSGKTTLMRIMLGEEHPDAGRLTKPAEARVGYLPQEVFLVEGADGSTDRTITLWQLAAQAFDRLEGIKTEIERLENQMGQGDIDHALFEKHERLVAQFERAGGYTWQARLTRILKGLGFSESRFHEPFAHFSGGWRMRGYFARLLASDPDYLLLDEPTNYLDIGSIAFVEDYLKSFAGGILVVSHDRYFLDNLATSVVALVPEGARVFRGNYSGFLEARLAWQAEADAAIERQTKERQRIERFIERFRYKATKAAQVQSRIKMLGKMERIERPIDSRVLDFSFPKCQASGEMIMQVKNVNRSFGDLQVLRQVDFSLYRGDRLCIVGENGVGKTTLMRILARQDTGFHGDLSWGYRVYPAYFAQDEEISFEQEETISQRMMRECPIEMVPQLRGLLGAFLFSGDDIDKPVRVLSGGEKSRLGIARLMMRPCNLLMMDEPTNHLDISSREALLEALDEFPGTLIIVSHDRFFLDELATRVLVLDGGRATVYEGNYSQYLWRKQQAAKEEAVQSAGTHDRGSTTVAETNGGSDSGADAWKARRRQNNQRQKLEKENQQIETQISGLEEGIRDIESRLASPRAGTTHEELAQWARDLERSQRELDAAMRRWEELQTQLVEPEQMA
ncbi:MAG TPA: ABC-F family ATP-binding cassette domain-containing protein [Candidatus Ozemobacteraceae bacterium]|nr:ABC-F family ATP-binding cassette domain-containing protein [Candidatus Ozemobacteraceae bacterium]